VWRDLGRILKDQEKSAGFHVGFVLRDAASGAAYTGLSDNEKHTSRPGAGEFHASRKPEFQG
jgi:hypothetical protein